MGNKLAKVAAETRDLTKERDGIEITYLGPGGDGTFRVRVRRAGAENPDFHKLSEKLLRPIRRSGRDMDELPLSKQREITRQLYAHTVVLGWNEEDFGEPFTPENAIATFEADNDFLSFVVGEAIKAHNFRRETVAEIAGN